MHTVWMVVTRGVAAVVHSVTIGMLGVTKHELLHSIRRSLLPYSLSCPDPAAVL